MIYMKAIYKLLALIELTDLSKLIEKKKKLKIVSPSFYENSFSKFLRRVSQAFWQMNPMRKM